MGISSRLLEQRSGLGVKRSRVQIPAARLVGTAWLVLTNPSRTASMLTSLVAAYERRSLGVASHFGLDQWGHFLPEHTTVASLLDRLIHRGCPRWRTRSWQIAGHGSISYAT